MMQMDNSKLQAEVTYNLTSGRKMFYEGDSHSDKEAGLLRYAKGLQSFNLWIQRTSDPMILTNLKNNFNGAVDEYQKMKDLLEGKSTGPSGGGSGGAGRAGGDGAGKGKGGKGGAADDKESSKMKEALGEAIVTEKPNVKWTDIAGLENAKKALQEAVILPIKYPQLFVGAVKPWKGILLYGPPGTGKTYLAKACATETDGTFFSISSADLISKYVGESEKMIKTLFAMAREKKPAVIFIDEIDSLCGSRSDNENDATRRVKTEFLVQMQGVGNDSDGILVLGATNLPWGLDSAIRRRFERRIYIPLPDYEARRFLVESNLKKNKHLLNKDNMDEIARKTEGFSGSDMANLVKDAVYGPVRKCQLANHFARVMDEGKQKFMPVLERDLNKWHPSQIVQKTLTDFTGDELKVPDVDMDDFREALLKSKSSVSQDQLQEYVKWTKDFGQDG
jgi:vacuolar protein-sorting-associated protein 4